MRQYEIINKILADDLNLMYNINRSDTFGILYEDVLSICVYNRKLDISSIDDEFDNGFDYNCELLSEIDDSFVSYYI